MLKLITVLTSGIPAIIASVLAFITRKIGTAAGTIAAYIIITAGFILCINAILQAVLSMMLAPTWIANSVGMFIPIDFVACLTAIVSSKICRAAYDMAKFKITAINSAS